MRSHIDFRVLTDVESGFIRHDTYTGFIASPHTEIRSLLSLHAKIYLIDDWCLLTSANLTGMAFSARHEVGQVVSVQSRCQLFDQWWRKAEMSLLYPRLHPKLLQIKRTRLNIRYSISYLSTPLGQVTSS